LRQKTGSPLELSHRFAPSGEAVVYISGELDMTTADPAVRYVQKIIGRHHGPVAVNLAGIRFCDAQGLRALLRMANCADLAGAPFRVTSPSRMLAKVLRITGLSRRLLAGSPRASTERTGAGPVIAELISDERETPVSCGR
jgi:anti-anti-sigma factor